MTSNSRMIFPQGKSYWESDYVTYRRLWLDACLKSVSNEMCGMVVDFGGKRENKRGSFRPPENQADTWLYVNLDMATRPNIYADVTRTPLMKESIDCVICTEVLEHLPNPQACVDEIHRLLHDDGLVFASVPFFYPVHANPYDFQRFTEDGLRRLFRDFKTVEVYRMGGYPGVLGLLLEIGISGVDGNLISQKFLRWAMKWVSRWLCRYDLANFGKESVSWQKYTTGYFVRAAR